MNIYKAPNVSIYGEAVFQVNILPREAGDF